MSRLTQKQAALLQEAEAIARELSLDLDRVENRASNPTSYLEEAIHRMVVSEVVQGYTSLDEVLGLLIVQYFFDYSSFRGTQKCDRFFHYVLEEMYLLKKMKLVHAIEPLPNYVKTTITKTNDVRNAFAHSAFPELRRQHYTTEKVLYKDKDIRTHDGLKMFKNDCEKTFFYLENRVKS